MPLISSVLSVADHGCGSYNMSEICSWFFSVICGFCGPCVKSIAAHSLRAPNLLTKFSISYPNCLYSLDACCRNVVNVKCSLLQSC